LSPIGTRPFRVNKREWPSVARSNETERSSFFLMKGGGNGKRGSSAFWITPISLNQPHRSFHWLTGLRRALFRRSAHLPRRLWMLLRRTSKPIRIRSSCCARTAVHFHTRTTTIYRHSDWI